ncbi:hypothetical protein [Lentzea jiangxiensis]|nr:hypothetical protein [Lentzea jiangxiensis]
MATIVCPAVRAAMKLPVVVLFAPLFQVIYWVTVNKPLSRHLTCPW